LLEHAGLESLAADVVEEEKRMRAKDRDVVDAMVHEIHADGIMSIQGERDLQFRADAIDARDQNRVAHPGKGRAKQSAEPADLSEDLRAMRFFDERLNLSLQPIPKIDVNARCRIGFLFVCHVERSRDISEFLRNSKRFRFAALGTGNYYFRSAKSVGCAS
jgi:hypothetical protein